MVTVVGCALVVCNSIYVVIEQVTGVMLMCGPVDLINQCTVSWNMTRIVSHFFIFTVHA